MLLDILHAEGHDAAVGVKRALGAALYGLGDKELLDDISKTVKLEPGNILYVVRKKEDAENYYGSFIYGKRRSAPWVGYGTKPNDSEDK